MNDGLKKLGEKESVNGESYEGKVFWGSAVESVRIPYTLKVIENNTFRNCKSLKNIQFEEGL